MKSRRHQKAAKRKNEPIVINRGYIPEANNPYKNSSAINMEMQDLDEIQSSASEKDAQRESLLKDKGIDSSVKQDSEKDNNEKSRMEIRGVETIEEFFRPEFA